MLIFSGLIPIGGEKAAYEGEVKIWGFVSERDMNPIVLRFNEENKNYFTIKYTHKEPGSFENQLINALARGEGPDLVMFPNNLIVSQGDKLLTIPFESYPERTFRDTFAEAGEIFLSKQGIVSLPLYADPLVMYWNRDMLKNIGLVVPPKNWVEVLALSNKLTQKDEKGNVFQSAVSLGTYNNITNAKEILLTLFLQVGESIISRNAEKSVLGRTFEVVVGQESQAAGAALNFYTEFSNPAKSSYSWNPSLPNSRSFFSQGKLAIYFGKASEYNSIKLNNPHLNFDVALIPQRDDSATRITYADVIGISVLKASPKLSTATKVMYVLTNQQYSKSISAPLNLPPLRRDNLSSGASDPVQSVFYNSAIISKTWYDPDAMASNDIFRNVVNSIISGKDTALSALRNAQARFIQYVK